MTCERSPSRSRTLRQAGSAAPPQCRQTCTPDLLPADMSARAGQRSTCRLAGCLRPVEPMTQQKLSPAGRLPSVVRLVSPGSHRQGRNSTVSIVSSVAFTRCWPRSPWYQASTSTIGTPPEAGRASRSCLAAAGQARHPPQKPMTCSSPPQKCRDTRCPTAHDLLAAQLWPGMPSLSRSGSDQLTELP